MSLDIKSKGTGVIGVFKWRLPTPLRSQIICSPLFEKWERKWRLFAKDDFLALQYVQGVESIHLDLRYAPLVINRILIVYFQMLQSNWLNTFSNSRSVSVQ